MIDGGGTHEENISLFERFNITISLLLLLLTYYY